MSTALLTGIFGLIGVLIGGVLAHSLQVHRERSIRRRAARRSARRVRAQLLHMSIWADQCLEDKKFGLGMEWSPYAWDEAATDLVVEMTEPRWIGVDTTYVRIRQCAEVSEKLEALVADLPELRQKIDDLRREVPGIVIREPHDPDDVLTLSDPMKETVAALRKQCGESIEALDRYANPWWARGTMRSLTPEAVQVDEARSPRPPE